MDEQMLYLIEKIQNFSKSISEKVEVGGILKEVSTFDTKYRGKELPGFVSYRTFQEIVKMNIEMLRSPAIELLKEVAAQDLPSRNCPIINEKSRELANRKSAGIRIGTQIPMIIRTCVLHDCAEKLQTAVLMLLQNKDHSTTFCFRRRNMLLEGGPG
ncbi:Interferon-induced GTP-binding protein Mx1 [Varanus komodoensis]|nr:Interferon-induced GTP-binding protein Mx1 [Varanus komodoensis]